MRVTPERESVCWGHSGPKHSCRDFRRHRSLQPPAPSENRDPPPHRSTGGRLSSGFRRRSAGSPSPARRFRHPRCAARTLGCPAPLSRRREASGNTAPALPDGPDRAPAAMNSMIPPAAKPQSLADPGTGCQRKWPDAAFGRECLRDPDPCPLSDPAWWVLVSPDSVPASKGRRNPAAPADRCLPVPRKVSIPGPHRPSREPEVQA